LALKLFIVTTICTTYGNVIQFGSSFHFVPHQCHLTYYLHPFLVCWYCLPENGQYAI